VKKSTTHAPLSAPEKTAKNDAADKLVFVANVASPLSKQQKKFNDLVKAIQKWKDEMAYLKEVLPQAANRIDREINAEKKKSAQVSVLFFKGLDKQLDTVKLSSKDYDALVEYLINEMTDLMGFMRMAGEDIRELEVIYDKYSEETYAEQRQLEHDMAQDMFGNVFKSEFGADMDFDIDISKIEGGDMEYIMELQEKMKAAQEKALGEKAEKAASKPKTAKQQAKAEKEAEAKKKIEKNTRTIYFDLAKKLHPDAIPDDEQKEWKVGLMQRLAVARDNDDLYEMLQIQIELQQADDNALSKVGDETMSHYIKVLQQQLDTARMEAVRLKESFPGFYDFFDAKNQFSEHKFKTELNRIKKEMAFEQNRIANLKNPKWLKALAKEARMMQQFQPFGNMFDVFG
jgi:hypothetical protein